MQLRQLCAQCHGQSLGSGAGAVHFSVRSPSSSFRLTAAMLAPGRPLTCSLPFSTCAAPGVPAPAPHPRSAPPGRQVGPRSPQSCPDLGTQRLGAHGRASRTAASTRGWGGHPAAQGLRPLAEGGLADHALEELHHTAGAPVHPPSGAAAAAAASAACHHVPPSRLPGMMRGNDCL